MKSNKQLTSLIPKNPSIDSRLWVHLEFVKYKSKWERV